MRELRRFSTIFASSMKQFRLIDMPLKNVANKFIENIQFPVELMLIDICLRLQLIALHI